MIEADELLTVKQVSKIMKSNPNYVNRLINTGMLKCLILGSRKIRTSTLNEFLARWEGWDLTDPGNPKQIIGDGKEELICSSQP